jgi:polysaccharide export outer membrane protein
VDVTAMRYRLRTLLILLAVLPPLLWFGWTKDTLPTYVIEPPDILVVEAIHVVPKSPYGLRTGDIVAISVVGTLPEAPISGAFPIQPGGSVNLGTPYGSVKFSGLTVGQAQEEIRRVLAVHLRDPVISVSLVEMSGKQQIAGQHLVAMDGTITLGSYGSVSITGLTLAQAKQSIEQHLSQSLEDPEVAIDVYASNSKFYYVITKGAGLGNKVTRFPVTGNKTVLDALPKVNGLAGMSSTRIWVARPVPHTDQIQIMPVDWHGDRIFVVQD